MIVNDKTALVDNDFICHISETRLPCEKIVDAMTRILAKLEKCAAIHTLVKQKELLLSSTGSEDVVDLLFSNGIISVAEFSDIFQGDTAKERYYNMLVRNFYSVINTDEINDVNDILTFWKAKKSLGEIHSLATCIVCGCCIFLSDDKDSKKIAGYIKSKSIGDIVVLDREELVNLEKVSSEFNRAERKKLAHSNCG